MLNHRRTLTALGLAFSLLATPAAAQPTDTRPAAKVRQDLRSPDTRDIANHYSPRPVAPVTPASEPKTVATAGTDIDWTTTVLAPSGYLLAVVAGAFALRSRKRVAA